MAPFIFKLLTTAGAVSSFWVANKGLWGTQLRCDMDIKVYTLSEMLQI